MGYRLACVEVVAAMLFGFYPELVFAGGVVDAGARIISQAISAANTAVNTAVGVAEVVVAETAGRITGSETLQSLGDDGRCRIGSNDYPLQNLAGCGGSQGGASSTQLGDITTSCGSLTFPTDVWHEIYTVHSSGQCLGEHKEDTRWDFDADWGDREIDFGRSDDVELNMGRTRSMNAGTYKFTLGSDDGSRLWIDGAECVDNWGDHGYQEKSCSKSLSSGNHAFRINYYENGGGARVSFKTEKELAPPAISIFSPSGFVIEYSSSQGGDISLSWSSSGADSCRASGDWSGTKPTSGSETITKPRGEYSFTLSCSGPGGSTSSSVGPYKIIKTPQCSFSASKPEIEFAPDYSMLLWSCKYAQSCLIDQGIGSVSNISGSKKVSPAQTTTYSLNCQGADGSRAFYTQVKVKRPEGVHYQEF